MNAWCSHCWFIITMYYRLHCIACNNNSRLIQYMMNRLVHAECTFEAGDILSFALQSILEWEDRFTFVWIGGVPPSTLHVTKKKTAPLQFPWIESQNPSFKTSVPLQESVSRIQSCDRLSVVVPYIFPWLSAENENRRWPKLTLLFFSQFIDRGESERGFCLLSITRAQAERATAVRQPGAIE